MFPVGDQQQGVFAPSAADAWGDADPLGTHEESSPNRPEEGRGEAPASPGSESLRGGGQRSSDQPGCGFRDDSTRGDLCRLGGEAHYQGRRCSEGDRYSTRQHFTILEFMNNWFQFLRDT